MDRQFRRNLPHLLPIPRLLPRPDLLMQAYPVPGRHAYVHHLVIQGMDELIARRDRPIRPRLCPPGPEKLPLARERGIARFKCLRGVRDTRGHRGHRKGAPRDTGGFQQRLVRCGQLGEVLLNVLSEAQREALAEDRQRLLTASRICRALEVLVTHQVVDQGHEEQRMTARALIHAMHQAGRQGCHRAALR